MIGDLRAQPGTEFNRALWNKLVATIQAQELSPGPGVLLRKGSSGTIISFQPSPGLPDVRFAPTLAGARVSFGVGLVNGLEPRLEGRPISGILPDLTPDPKGQPSLALDEKMYDSTGTSWIALRCRIDDSTGRIIQPDEDGKGPLDLTLVQTLTLSDEDSTYGFHRVALLRRSPNAREGFGRIYHVGKFDYQHRTSRGNQRWRHFFDPA